MPHAHAGTVTRVLPVLRPGTLVEPADLVGGTLDRPAQRRVEPGEGAVEHVIGDDEAAVDVDAVEAEGERRERVVTVTRDRSERVDDPGTRLLEVDAGPWHPVPRVAAVAPEVEDTQAGHGGSRGDGRRSRRA